MPTPRWLPDKILIGQIRRGDKNAFAGIYDRHVQRIFSLMYRLTGSVEIAEDLTQEAFLAAFRALPTYPGRIAFATWLRGVSLNTYRTYMRYAGNQPDTETLTEDGSLVSEGNESVSQTARQLRGTDDPVPSKALRAWTLEKIGRAELPTFPSVVFPVSIVVAGGLVAVVLLVTVAFFAHPRHIPAQPAAQATFLPGFKPDQLQFLADVQTAVNRTNSWHIVGRRTTGNHPIDFEVWGRSQPYFFREQAGGCTVVDDGKTQLCAFKLTRNAPGIGSSHSGHALPDEVLTLRTSHSEPWESQLSGLERVLFHEKSFSSKFLYVTYLSNQPAPYDTLVKNLDDRGKAIDVLSYSKNESGSVDAKENGTLVVASETHLPRRIKEVSWDLNARDALKDGTHPIFFSLTMTAEYNVDIPSRLLTIQSSPQVQIIDQRRQNAALATPARDLSGAAVTLRVVNSTQDAEGNIRLQYDLCSMGSPYRGHVLDVLTRNADNRLLAYGEDDLKRVYVFLGDEPPSASDHATIFLTPEVPLTHGVARPSRITLHLIYAPENVTDDFPITGIIDGSVWPPQKRWLTATTVVPTPSAEFVIPEVRQVPSDKQHPTDLTILTATARAQYFEGGGRDRAAKWEKNVESASIPDALKSISSASHAGPSPSAPVTALPEDSSANRALAAHWWDVAAAEADRLGDRKSALRFHFNADSLRNARGNAK